MSTVRVVSVCQDQVKGADRLERTLFRLDEALTAGPDIACLPETFSGNEAEELAGATVDAISKRAADRACNIICPIRVQRDGHLYNTALVIDRSGEIVGHYDKIHPTEGELKQGIQPGDGDPPIFKLDVATIGIQICFDVNWWEPWTRLKEKGAQIVFWPSAYPADRQLSALAWKHEYYIVSSTKTRMASVYDITGDVLSRSGGYQQWANALLHLDKQVFEIDYHLKAVRRIRQRYGERITVEWHHDEDWFTLTSLDPELGVADVVREFELIPRRDYLARSHAARDAYKSNDIHALPVSP